MKASFAILFVLLEDPEMQMVFTVDFVYGIYGALNGYNIIHKREMGFFPVLALMQYLVPSLVM